MRSMAWLETYLKKVCNEVNGLAGDLPEEGL